VSSIAAVFRGRNLDASDLAASGCTRQRADGALGFRVHISYIRSISNSLAEAGGAMVADKTKVLLVLPSEVLDRARVLAGKATTALKLPVSLQIVLRALIEEGLKRGDTAVLFENFERQARNVRDIRRAARERMRPDGGSERPATGPRRSTTPAPRPRRRT
jgi:hypothetical protein